MTRFLSVRRRFQLFYGLNFAGIGIFFPYIALYLRDMGLSGTQIGTLLGMMPLISFLVQPVWGMLSDIYSLRRSALVFACFSMGLTSLGFLLTSDFRWLFVITFVMSIVRGPINPIGTALALEHLENEGRDDEFGSLRLWGSIGFAITSLLIGEFIVESALQHIITLFSLNMILLSVLTLTLPDAPVTQEINWREGVTLLKREPVLTAFLIGSLFVGATLGIANQYLSIYMEDINATGRVIGAALAVAALMEVPLMAKVPSMLARWGLRAVLVGGVAVLPVRWFLYIFIEEPVLVIPTQVLHSIAIMAVYVVGIMYVDKLLSRQWRATGQAVYSAGLTGIGPSIGLFAAGIIYEQGGIRPVWAIATVVSLVGLGVMAWAVRVRTPSEAREGYQT